MTEKEKAAVVFFRHFSQRLSERYGLLISFDYYLTLSSLFLRSGKFKVKDDGQTHMHGYLIIHDVKVRVIKSTSWHKLLITALPLKNDNH